MGISKSFWKDRKVFVTGNTGFKGSWFSVLLNELGSKVTGFALAANTEPNLFDLSGVKDRVEDQHIADIRNYDALLDALKQAEPEIVFHLAAQPLVREAHKDPLTTYEINMMGTANLMEAVRATPSVKTVVVITTDKVYLDTRSKAPHTELEALGGDCPYSTSKACAELISHTAREVWARDRNLGLATTRAGNVIGGGDWSKDRLVPDCVRAVKNSDTLKIRNPDAVRPWQHVLDALFGYLTLAEQLTANPAQYAHGWNFGPPPEAEVKVLEIANTVMTALGKPEALVVEPDDGPKETAVLRLDSSRARSELQWRGRLPIADTIQWTAEWYAAWSRDEDVAAATAKQIQDYISADENAVDVDAAEESGKVANDGDYHDVCRFCDSPLEHTMVDLGKVPPSNSFVPGGLPRSEVIHPLKVQVCKECLLAQVGVYEEPDAIFSSDYAYFSSVSSSWLDHCAEYARSTPERWGINKDKMVIEIASNDGYMLKNFTEMGVPCLGIEPSANVADAAVKIGIPTRVEFFTEKLARELVAQGIQGDLIMGLNVLAHNPDIRDFVAGLGVLVSDTGVVHMEFPHLLRLMEECQFDTIYHEHFSYLSLHAVQKIFAANGLEVFEVDEVPTHGGSIRVFAHRAGSDAHPRHESVDRILEAERDYGIDDVESYAAFQTRVDEVKFGLLSFLIDCKRKGKTVVGYGAPAKGNTLLCYSGVGPELLPFTVDLSPRKQGWFTPGTSIPVYSPDKLKEVKPDYVLILPWNIKDEIMSQMSHVGDWGGRFVVAIPEIQVLGD